jgi:hypothetical protein
MAGHEVIPTTPKHNHRFFARPAGLLFAHFPGPGGLYPTARPELTVFFVTEWVTTIVLAVRVPRGAVGLAVGAGLALAMVDYLPRS